MKRGWAAISALWASLVLLGCFPPSGLEQQIRLESTVMAMQTEVAIELADLRELVSTPVAPIEKILSPTPVPVIPTSTPIGVSTSLPESVVTTDVLNLRGGPGLEYDIVGHLQKGNTLQARARVKAGDWVKVSIGEGLEGWVAIEFVALNVSLDSIPLAVEIPPTPTLGPTSLATTTPGSAAHGTPTAAAGSSEG